MSSGAQGVFAELFSITPNPSQAEHLMERLPGDTPASELLAKLEANFINDAVVVASYDEPWKAGRDALSPPLEGENAFGGCLPSRVNRER